ncbi:MAG TPA: AcvB/VirJ family lysyl-phosphatidylglycerol hydrolase [Vicinamibacterales bacterium]|nr:AcvB/VirJ family lysyl-phosphatidylglycerol hydrolase [Vicinamibacterales bacterium]
MLTAVLAGAPPATAASADKLDVQVRGRTIMLTIYHPRTAPRGTILMGSGDVGWVGLAVSMAEELSAAGYLVIGLNARQYLSAFTAGTEHATTLDVPSDYRSIADRLKEKQLLVRPVVVAGVSEGAALAVLAGADAKNHDWIDGVMTMGLPMTAELAWRWTDLWAAAVKKDADEPSFTVADFVARVSPVPLWMIQSRTDEYVPPADYERLRTFAKPPAQLVLIDAANHRFTDRRPDLSRAVAAGLQWIANAGRP